MSKNNNRKMMTRASSELLQLVSGVKPLSFFKKLLTKKTYTENDLLEAFNSIEYTEGKKRLEDAIAELDAQLTNTLTSYRERITLLENANGKLGNDIHTLSKEIIDKNNKITTLTISNAELSQEIENAKTVIADNDKRYALTVTKLNTVVSDKTAHANELQTKLNAALLEIEQLKLEAKPVAVEKPKAPPRRKKTTPPKVSCK